MSDVKLHPRYNKVETPCKTVVVGGTTYTVYMHKTSPSSELCLHVGTKFGDPISIFLEENLVPIAKWFKNRAAMKAAITRHIGEEAAEEDLKAELMDLLGSAQVNIKALTKSIMRGLIDDDTGQLIRDVFTFTQVDGEWLVGEHYENHFAGRIRDLLVLGSYIWSFNGWLDFLSSASEPEEVQEASQAPSLDSKLSALPE